MASEVASAKGCIADLESIIKEQDQAVASAAGKIAALEERLQAAHLRAVAKSTQCRQALTQPTQLPFAFVLITLLQRQLAVFE